MILLVSFGSGGPGAWDRSTDKRKNQVAGSNPEVPNTKFW